MLTGRLIMGTEAAEMGLASRAVPADQVLTTAMEMARDIAINVAPVSAATAKKLMWDGMNTTLDAMIATEGNLLPVFTAAADSGEGVRAFFEKRTPEWQSCVSKDMPSIPE
jgi:enoyl-CoA hydratase/carnithine racemase